LLIRLALAGYGTRFPWVHTLGVQPGLILSSFPPVVPIIFPEEYGTCSLANLAAVRSPPLMRRQGMSSHQLRNTKRIILSRVGPKHKVTFEETTGEYDIAPTWRALLWVWFRAEHTWGVALVGQGGTREDACADLA
jgi:hypothetical protein